MFAGTAKKLENYIPFPEVLDIRPFLAPRKEKYGLDKRGRTPRLRVESESLKSNYHPHNRPFDGAEEEDPPVRYQLCAVVVHIGNMVNDTKIFVLSLQFFPDSICV